MPCYNGAEEQIMRLSNLSELDRSMCDPGDEYSRRLDLGFKMMGLSEDDPGDEVFDEIYDFMHEERDPESW